MEKMGLQMAWLKTPDSCPQNDRNYQNSELPHIQERKQGKVRKL